MINVVAAVIHNNDGKIYICKRAENGILGGYWEFPGGKVEKGENYIEALKREIREELSSEISVGELLDESIYHYENFSVNLICYKCTLILGNCTSVIHSEEIFESIENFDNYEFAPADYNVINILKSYKIDK
jgi:8-oxo-dGTP diphosphatase